MSLPLLLVIVLILVLVGLPQVGGSFHNLGYGPSGLLGVVLVIVLISVLMRGV